MKTLTQVAIVASVVLLLSGAGYAVGQNRLGMPANAFPPMVLPVAGPAVNVTPASSPAPTPMGAPAPAAATTRPNLLTERIGAIFGKAKEAFVRANLKLAALEVRRGAAVLRSEESNASPDIKKELAATALDLELLALRI